LLGSILIILGLAAAGLGVASATVWRESDSVVATATPRGDGTLVVTDPGVLELVGSDVTVVASVPGDGKVTVAVGRDIDVVGWVGVDHYTRVTGLTDWTTLATAAEEPEIPAPAEGAEAPTPGVGADPAGNDMWVAQATDEGSVTLRWTDRPGRWSLLAAGVGEDAQAPTLELTWPRTPATPWLWPGVGVGAVLLVAGLAVLLLRRKPRAATADGPGSQDAGPQGGGLDDAAQESAGQENAGQKDAGPDAAGPDGAGSALDSVTDAGHALAQEGPGYVPAAATAAAAPLMTRRSRRKGAAAGASHAVPAPDAERAPAAPQETDAPTDAAEDAPETDTATGAIPMLSRRERREQEEARRAAEHTGLTGRLRALTGSLPVVRPPEEPAADAPPARAGHASAWRQAWGFDPVSSDTTHRDAEPDAEGDAR
jgi:hypothetical protein